MATTTANYGFDVPTSTDLVKNGATQIALLGQDLDTFLFRPFTRNGIINSGMNVAQRGTTFTSATGATYTLDRWQGYRTASAAYNISQQSTADTTNLPFIQYCARVGRPSGNTATNIVFYVQTMETLNSRQFSGKTVTLSFYARAGANYSAASNALGCEVVTGTGTDQNAITGFTGAASAFSQNNTLTTTWQRFTITGSIASTSTQLGLNFYYTPVGTAGANDYFEVTGVQIEVGNQASPYCPAGSSYQAELAMCQRYFERIDSALGTTFTPFGAGACASTTQAYDTIFYTYKRTSPSLSFAAANTFSQTNTTGAAVICTAISSAASGVTSALILGTVASGLVAGNATNLYRNSSAAAYIDISAEL
jgi:hypothetical protein